MNPILSLLLWNIAQYLGFRVEDFIEFWKVPLKQNLRGGHGGDEISDSVIK